MKGKKEVVIKCGMMPFRLSYVAIRYILSLKGKSCFFYKPIYKQEEPIYKQEDRLSSDVEFHRIENIDEISMFDVCLVKTKDFGEKVIFEEKDPLMIIDFEKHESKIDGYCFYPESKRENPLLIKAVKELGGDVAYENPPCPDEYLKVVKIPSNIKYYIDRNDDTGGYEKIHEKHRIWR